MTALLQFFSVISFGIDGLGVPLQCVGLHGYKPTLVFMIVAPFMIVVVVLLGAWLFIHLRNRYNIAAQSTMKLDDESEGGPSLTRRQPWLPAAATTQAAAWFNNGVCPAS